MSKLISQENLTRKFNLVFISKGPLDGMWQCDYLKCPICGYFVFKGKGYDKCLCGNISIDSDALRVVVLKTPKSEIETYKATKKKLEE